MTTHLFHLSLNHYVILSLLIFMIGLFGLIINRKHLILSLISLEVMLLSVNINFITFSYFLKDYAGHIFTLMILTVAAAEAAIGLAIIVTYFKVQNTIDMTSLTHLKG